MTLDKVLNFLQYTEIHSFILYQSHVLNADLKIYGKKGFGTAN